MKKKQRAPKKKRKVGMAFKIKSARSYAGELGVSLEAAWRRLWPGDFK